MLYLDTLQGKQNATMKLTRANRMGNLLSNMKFEWQAIGHLHKLDGLIISLVFLKSNCVKSTIF
jgi:hypothetical protein